FRCRIRRCARRRIQLGRGCVDVNRVISVCNRIRNDFAYLSQDGLSQATTAWRGAQVDDVASVSDSVAHRSACVSVFVRGIGVGRLPDTAIKGVKSSELITYKRRVVPILPPENGGGLSRDHNVSAM